jgi:phage gp29-like protein
MYSVLYKGDGLRLTDYLCVLFVGDGPERRSERIIAQHVGLEKNMGISKGVNGTMVYITNDEISRCILGGSITSVTLGKQDKKLGEIHRQIDRQQCDLIRLRN